MKKFFRAALSAALALSLIPASAALAAMSLAELQNYVYTHAPASATEVRAEISGTIQEIHWAGASNHYEMTLAVDDEKAIPPMGSDKPQIAVHFRLHLDAVPFQVGDQITVSGTLNTMYSSMIIPYIHADKINGSEDF